MELDGGVVLGEPKNVVNEEQHVLALFISEVSTVLISYVQSFTQCIQDLLSNGKTSKSDTGTGTRGLVHLTEDKGDLGVTVKLNDGSLLHLVVQIVTLTGTLTDTSEDGETTVGLGDVVLPAVS